MKSLISALVLALLSLPAYGQSGTAVKQSGNVTPKHAAAWTTSGVIQDGGTAAVPYLTSIGTVGEGPTICANSAAVTGPYVRMCLSANTGSPAQLTVQNYGGAAAQGLEFNINGVAVALPAGSGTTFVTASGALNANHIPCFVSSAPQIVDCGLVASAGVITGGTWNANPIGLAYGGTNASTAAGARTNLGLGTIAVQDASAVAITGGTVTGLPAPTGATDAANKSYVDSLSQGLHILPPSRLATTTVLSGTPTYANGASGVGATLTAGSNGALSIDGTAVASSDVVLIKNQVSTTGCTVANAGCQNGIYTVTATGDGSNPYVLTRATYFDQAAEMLAGSYTYISAGASNVGSAFVLQSAVTTVGTTPVTFYIFSNASTAVTSIQGQTGPFTCGVTMNCSSATLQVALLSLTNAYISNSAAIVSTKLSNTTDGTSAVARTVQSKLNDSINVRDFGALCDGGTDDTAAFTAAITYLTSLFGGQLNVPNANCVITSITIPDRITISGDNQGRSNIYTKSATADVFNVTGGNVTIENLQFGVSGVTKSAGAFIKLTNAGGLFRNLVMNGGYDNFYITSSTFWTIENVNAGTTAHDGIFCTGTSDLGVIDKVIMSGNGTASSNAGYHTDRCGDIQISKSQFLSFSKGVFFDACNPGCDIAANNLESVVLDHNTWGVYGITSGASSTISRNNFVNVSATSGNGDGVFFNGAGGGSISGLYFVNLQANDNANAGIQLINNVSGLQVNGGLFASNTGTGILINANISDFSVIGAKVGAGGGWGNNGGFGIQVVAGTSNNYVITLNNLRNNTAGAISDGGTGINKIVTSNIQ